mmetsp:Transcript_21757/g.44676  ORF Transcript_21757/g.44676 Transcript_21757/m.44676 type:complete len:273 (+) Transcript_21757:271-1089(+)
MNVDGGDRHLQIMRHFFIAATAATVKVVIVIIVALLVIAATVVHMGCRRLTLGRPVSAISCSCCCCFCFLCSSPAPSLLPLSCSPLTHFNTQRVVKVGSQHLQPACQPHIPPPTGTTTGLDIAAATTIFIIVVVLLSSFLSKRGFPFRFCHAHSPLSNTTAATATTAVTDTVGLVAVDVVVIATTEVQELEHRFLVYSPRHSRSRCVSHPRLLNKVARPLTNTATVAPPPTCCCPCSRLGTIRSTGGPLQQLVVSRLARAQERVEDGGELGV